jgi:hypothetical protein
MTNKLFTLIVLWLVFNFTNYFCISSIVQPLSWLLVCLILLILLLRQIYKAIRERKNLKTNRLLNLSITLILFYITFYKFGKIPELIIEKIDWNISYNTRLRVVNEVLTKKLKPNTKMNNGICKLPFNFPIISKGGNDIMIYENKEESKKTIKFYIREGFIDAPHTCFVFTNDNEVKKQYEEKIKTEPEYSWKLEENWYRVMERY